jgi:hypothetical protein
VRSGSAPRAAREVAGRALAVVAQLADARGQLGVVRETHPAFARGQQLARMEAVGGDGAERAARLVAGVTAETARRIDQDRHAGQRALQLARARRVSELIDRDRRAQAT